MATISKSTLKFLKDIDKNNHKEWFENNRDRYELAYEEMYVFGETLQKELQKIDDIVDLSRKKIIKRVYRDVRFSKDKTPYKNFIMGGFKRDTVWKRGGFAFRIKPGESVVGCGFWSPERDDLKLIRSHISQDASPLRKVLKSKKFKDNFGEMVGDQLKKAPQGYEPDHEAIDLLKYKQFLATRKFKDSEVVDRNFIKEVVKSYKAIRPFFDVMSEMLTHDLNGIPIYQ